MGLARSAFLLSVLAHFAGAQRKLGLDTLVRWFQGVSSDLKEQKDEHAVGIDDGLKTLDQNLTAIEGQAASGSPSALVEHKEGQQCLLRGPIEELSGEALEQLLDATACPMLLAVFSSSSPLTQFRSFAIMEEQIATAFPWLRYIRIDADQMSMRTFLQWDVGYLPVYMLYMPGAGDTGVWHRWPSAGNNQDLTFDPYNFWQVSAFVSASIGVPANLSHAWRRIDDDFQSGPLSPGSLSPGQRASLWNMRKLIGSWILIGLVSAKRVYDCRKLQSEAPRAAATQTAATQTGDPGTSTMND